MIIVAYLTFPFNHATGAWGTSLPPSTPPAPPPSGPPGRTEPGPAGRRPNSDQATAMAKFLEVTVISVRNLPKMDTYGSCDPFCRLMFCGKQMQTTVKRNTYTAAFDETFVFDLSNHPNPSALSIEVLDWDMLGPYCIIGKIVLPDTVISKIMELGDRQEFEYNIMSVDGKYRIVGSDRAETVIEVAFRFVDTTLTPASSLKLETQSNRILEIKASCAIAHIGTRKSSFERADQPDASLVTMPSLAEIQRRAALRPRWLRRATCPRWIAQELQVSIPSSASHSAARSAKLRSRGAPVRSHPLCRYADHPCAAKGNKEHLLPRLERDLLFRTRKERDHVPYRRAT